MRFGIIVSRVNLSGKSFVLLLLCLLAAFSRTAMAATDPAATTLTCTPNPLAFSVRAGESASLPLQLANPSNGAVEWTLEFLDASGNPNSLEAVMAAVNASGTTLNSPLPSRYDFTEGETGTTIVTGTPSGYSAVFTQGNKLTSNLGGPLPYSNNSVASSTVLGTGGRYFTRKLPGLFLFAGDLDAVSWFEIAGTIYNGISRQTSAFTITRGSTQWSAFVVRFADYYRTTNHLILVDQTGLTQTTATATGDEKHRISGLTGKRRLCYLLYVTSNTTFHPDSVFQDLGNRMLNLMPNTLPGVLSAKPMAGTTPAAGESTLSITTNAVGMAPGTFPANIALTSPPTTRLATVPVTVEITAPRLTVPAAINHATVSGVVPATVEIPLTSNLPEPQAWSATLPSAPAWLSLVTSSGTTPTPLRLRFTPGSLAAGTYQATLHLASGPAVFDVPITFRVDALAISKLLPDPSKPLVYAINKNGLEFGQIVVLDAIGHTLLRTIPVGKEPTDLDFTEDGSHLVVINSKDPSLSFIDLATQQVVETIPLTSFSSRSRAATEPGAHVKCGKGNIIYYVDEQWGPRLRVFDTASRTVLQVLGANSAASPNTNNDEGYGDIGLNPARTRLYGWRQYGDGAGIGGTNLIRFDIAPNGTLTGYTRGADNNSTNFTREPLDTPVLFSPDGSRLIIKDREVDQANLNVFPKIYLDEIYSLARNGSIATSAGAIHNLQTAASLGVLPVTTAVQALLPDLSALVYFNTTTKSLGWLDLEAALGAPALGLTATPANGALVINPTRLEWPAITGVGRYRIYFGTNQAEVLAAIPGSATDLGETMSTFLTLPSALATNQRYYWRVVPIGTDGNAAGSGTVRSFTASSFQLAPSSFTLRLPLTIQPQTIKIAVTGIDGHPAAWSVSESIPWFVPDAASGTAGTPLTGKISATGLTAGNYSGSLTVTAAGMSLAVPIAVTFYTPELIVLKPDPSRDWVYGLHRGSTTADESQLLAIRSATGGVEKVLAVGSNAQDFTINPVTDRLYVSNTGRPRMQVVDLAELASLPPLAVPDDIIGVAADHRGRIFANRNQTLAVLDAATGAQLGSATNAYSYSWGVVDAAGTRYYTTNTATNGYLVQYDVSANTPVQLRTLNLYSNNLERPSLSADGTRIFSWGRAFDADMNLVGASGEQVKCTVSNGRIAVGATKLWWVKSTTQAAALPFSASVSTVSRGDQFLLLYNATTRSVTSVRLDSLVPYPGLSPEPGESLVPGQPTALSWPAVTGAASYRVFFGTTEAAVQASAAGSVLELGTIATPSWNLTTPPPFGSRYFWRVDVIMAGGSTVKGAVWWFDVPMPELAPTLTVAPSSSSAAGLSMNVTGFGMGMTHLQDWGYHALRLDPADGRPSLWQSSFNGNFPYNSGIRYIIGQQTAVLGQPGNYSDSSPGANDGKLNLQKLVNGRWQDNTVLGPPSVPTNARLGTSLAYDGNLFMAGMPGGNVGGRLAIYREYPEFTFMQEIKPTNGIVGDNFGASIALQGNRVLIGAPGGWTTNGKGYIFEFQPTTRTWLQRATMVPPVPPGGTGIDITHGAAVALDGDTAVLGSGSSNVNQANVYTRSTATSWVKTATLANPKGAATGNGFGTALALAGNTLFVSDLSVSVRGAEAGVVYVFHRSGSDWRIGATIQPPPGAWRFGSALAARDGILYVSSSTAVHCYRIAETPNRIPRFTEAPPIQFVAGRALDLEIIATDADGTAGLSLQAEALPAGLVLQDLGAGRARLTGAPSGAAGTTHFLRWKAADPAGASVYQTSQITLIAADQLPVLATSPLTQQPPVGNDIVLAAAATGVGPFRWQWQKDGVDLPGATGPKLILNEITMAEGGTYTVTVSNVVGTVTSAGAVVTVRVPDPYAGNWETVGNSSAHHGHHAAALAGYRLAAAWTSNLGSGVTNNRAVIADGRVHVLSSAYYSNAPLRTLDLAAGTELWNFPIPSGSYNSPPSVRGGRVYFQKPGAIYCLNAATGGSEWSNPTFSSQGYSYGPLAVTDDGIFSINGYFGSMMGFETTGAIRFSTDLSATNGWAPAVLDGRVFSWSNNTFREHSPGDGSTLWSLANLTGDANFAVRSGCAVLTSQTALSCVDLNSRVLRWQMAGAFRSLPAIAGGRAFASQSTAVRSYSLADGTPGLVYQTTATTAAPLTSQPLILHDRLITASATTTWVFNLADGTLLQTLAAGGTLSYSNKYLLVAGNDGVLRAFIALNTNPKLASLTLGSGEFLPEFDSLKTRYIAPVPFDTATVTITPTTQYPAATVKINGVPEANGSASRPLSLKVGENELRTLVTAEDGITTMTYTIAVTRLPLDFVFNSAADIPVTSNGFATGGFPINIILNYPPVPGTTLTMVNNTSLAFIHGRFSNLAQGQRLWLSHAGGMYPFVANYHGGTGNDLVLQWAGTRVSSWGLNNYGQLGDGGNTQRLKPVAVDHTGVLADKTILAVSTGYLHSVALCSDGTLASWGYNVQGQLGDNSSANKSVPVMVDTSGVLAGRTVVAISSGSYHNLALCSDGTVAVWGYNNHGQLGDGTKTTARVPVLVKTDGILAGKQVVAVAAGAYQSYALCSDGTLAAWGYNDEGELGTGSVTGRTIPVAVDASGSLAGRMVANIAAGQYHALALCTDGTLVSWGYNQRGQLGNSSTADSKSPVAINSFGALSGKIVTAIGAGTSHSLALCADGTLAAWGYNSQSQLGVTGITQSTTPVAVPPATNSTVRTTHSLTVGAHHNLLRFTDGGMAAWGGNTNGQLGAGNTQASAALANVDTSALERGGFIMIAASGRASSHNLAVFAVTLDPPAGLEAWRYENFSPLGAANAVAGDCADCDLDGIPNLVEYAFGLDPNQNSAGQVPRPELVGNRLELRFNGIQLAPDIEYGAEWSPDLSPGSWRDVPDSGTGGEQVFSLPVDSAPHLFMRLRVRERGN